MIFKMKKGERLDNFLEQLEKKKIVKWNGNEFKFLKDVKIEVR